MRKRNITCLRQILSVVILLIFTSCDIFNGGDDKKTEETVNDAIYETFKEWYLWYDQILEIDPNKYETYDALIDAIRVDLDRWSFAGSLTDVMNLYEKGEYKGFGAGFMIDFDQEIKITQVFDASPFGEFGVERGWIVKSVNGFTVNELTKVNEALNSENPVNFVFTDLDGKTQNLTTSRQSFQMNSVLYSQVYEYDSHKIGYLVFDGFLGISVDELKPVIQEFHDQNVTDLIVDLRYNGGGENSAAEALIGMIGGEKVKGKTIATAMHNDKKTEMNNPRVSSYTGVSLDIDKVYFITTSGTASASEMVINCLNPFMEVKLVGSTTHGKPVGMYILRNEEYDLAILPICFKNVNSLDYGDYFNGFEADILEVDDLTHGWGDPNEKMLKAAINDIIEPVVVSAGSVATKSQTINKQRLFEPKGLNQFINAY